MRKEMVDSRGYLIVAMMFTIGTSILYTPNALTNVASQDAWISGLLGIGLVTVQIVLYAAVIKFVPGGTFGHVLEWVWGKWAGKAVTALYALFFVLLGGLYLRIGGNFLITYVMQDTPIESLHLLFIVMSVIGALLGFETVTRFCQLFAPLIILLFVLLIAMLLPGLEFSNLLPVLENGPGPIILGTLYYPVAAELIVLTMLVPYLNKGKNWGRSVAMGAMLGGMCVIIFVAMGIMTMGDKTVTRHVYSSYALAKTITFAGFLRVEAMVAIIWMITVVMKTMVTLQATAIAVARFFGWSDYRLATLPIAIALYGMSIHIYSSMSENIEFSPKAWSMVAYVFTLLIPLLVWTTGLVRKWLGRGGRREGRQEQAGKGGLKP